MTCWEAILDIFENEEGVLSTAQVIERIYKVHPEQPWQKNTITAHLMGLSVNHPTSRYYPSARKHAFLFWLGGGRYRRWNQDADGLWEVGEHGVQLVDTGGGEVEGIVEELETTALETTISLERDLERSLVGNLSQLQPNLRLYNENGLSGQQLDTGKVGRLDLLCVDQQGSLVVVELKAGRVDDKVCGQILRYMGWVRENLAHGKPVLGIIIGNEFSESMVYAVKAVSVIALKRYEVRFKFLDV